MPAPLLFAQEGPIATLTFNIPEKKNPITGETGPLLAQALEACQAPGVRVVVLTGAGGNFSAGASLDPTGGPDPRAADVTGYLRREVNPLILAMRALPKPIIAAVRGACVGVGMNFALAADLVYAAPSARFSQIFPKIGLSSDGGGAWFMPQLVGYRRAFELMATGAMIGAEEAERMGLINAVVADDALDAYVAELAARLAEGPAIAIANTKANLNVGLTGTLAETLDAEAVAQARAFHSADFQEGVMAFLQKRPAKFTGS